MADYVAFGDIHFTRDYEALSRQPFDEAAARKAVITDRVVRLKRQLGTAITDADVATETEAANLDFDSEVKRLIAIGSLVPPETIASTADLARDLNAAKEHAADLERQLAELQATRDGLAPQFSGKPKGAPATAAEIVSTPTSK